MNNQSIDNKLVYTVKNLCKVCYTCVRECPVKAIKIINGQAEVISERCIACGNCVMVCSQGAKVYLRSIEQVNSALNGEYKTVACIAPSFPAEFSEINDYRQLVGMIRKLGFDFVTEVGFGADLVSEEYRKEFDNPGTGSIITSDCPAIVKFIERYHPELVASLAPINSPAMSMANVVRKVYGGDVRPVFIGPCIAKKSESESYFASITFMELREMFVSAKISPDGTELSDFDPPFSGNGSIYAVNQGLLKSINRNEGFGKGEVMVAEGKPRFIEAVSNLENGLLTNQNLDLLCCDGCLQGPGMSKRGDYFIKRKRVNEYVAQKLAKLDLTRWEKEVNEYSGSDRGRIFHPFDQRLGYPESEKVLSVLSSMGRGNTSEMLNCGTCGYETCFEHAVAVVEGLAETEMCLPYTIGKLHVAVDKMNESNRKLAETKQALRQSEKLASMGQVSAGIAHELNNPLGIITLYSSILKEEIAADNPLNNDISIIQEQSERCRKIVSGLLNFARKNQVNLEECNFIDLVNHAFLSIIIPQNITLTFDHNVDEPIIKVDKDQMIQVFTNLFKNAIEAMPDGGYLKVRLDQSNGEMVMTISDTGTGINELNLDKVFTPFFTTKEPGKGTGLGLPLAYGIVKMHKGKIKLTSNSDPSKGKTGTTFRLILPRMN